MASYASMAALLLVCALPFHTCPSPCVQDQPITMTYHKGALFSGRIAVNLIWYNNFSLAQHVVINGFVSSLSAAPALQPQPETSIATWFKTAHKYYANSKARFLSLAVGSQVLNQSHSLGKRRR